MAKYLPVSRGCCATVSSLLPNFYFLEDNWKIISPGFHSFQEGTGSRNDELHDQSSVLLLVPKLLTKFLSFRCILKRVLTQNIGPPGPTGPAGPRSPQSFGVIIQKSAQPEYALQAHGAQGTIWLKVPGGTFQSLVNWTSSLSGTAPELVTVELTQVQPPPP